MKSGDATARPLLLLTDGDNAKVLRLTPSGEKAAG